METARYKNKIKFLILIFCLVLLWCLGSLLHIDTEALGKSLGRFPVLFSAIIYVALYVIITFFIFFSKDIFWVAGAVVFGAILSTLLVYIAEIINALILFHLARYLGRNFVEHHLKKKSETLDDRLANVNFFWLFIIRLVPLIPYRFLDLGVGLTKIHFRRYFTAVLLATPIRAFWMQYILAAVGKNIFKPEFIITYLLQNKALFIFSSIYLVLVILAAVKLKHKG
ncbi:MAG: VTT domain-containing protein [Candidatus Omnitrophota bacterium]|nr:VTT domain-containing protein [Candidatus Omnitrophota bacterium]